MFVLAQSREKRKAEWREWKKERHREKWSKCMSERKIEGKKSNLWKRTTNMFDNGNSISTIGILSKPPQQAADAKLYYYLGFHFYGILSVTDLKLVDFKMCECSGEHSLTHALIAQTQTHAYEWAVSFTKTFNATAVLFHSDTFNAMRKNDVTVPTSWCHRWNSNEIERFLFL